jgi:RimJ/RimL family protein N-acetyltransferase
VATDTGHAGFANEDGVIAAGPRTLSDAIVTLREIRKTDAEDLYRWRMDPQSRPMFHSTDVVPFETHLQFVQRYFTPGNTDAWFIIETKGLPVGTIVLYDISPDGTEAEWGRFVVAPEHRGRGFGRQALALLVAYARQRGILRLRCDVLASNEHTRRMYREVGWRGVPAPGLRAFPSCG